MLDCLEDFKKIIGLSDRVSTCFGGDAPAGYDESLSGYFITDYEDGINLLDQVNSAVTVDDASVWTILEAARLQAIKDFETELLQAIQSTQKQRFRPFFGDIGRESVGAVSLTSFPSVGMSFECAQIKGAYMEVSRIGLALNQTFVDSIDVSIIRRLDDDYQVIHTFDLLSSVANQMNYNVVTPVELPLWNEDCEHLFYYFVFDLPANTLPLKNKITCCGAVPDYRFFFLPSGIEFEEIDNSRSLSSDSFGLSITSLVQCKSLDWLCDIEELSGYSLLSVIGKTIQFKAAAKVISAILDSGNINRFTLSSRENLYGKRNHYNKRFTDNIAWIALNLPSGVSDCYSCKKERFKKSILV